MLLRHAGATVAARGDLEAVPLRSQTEWYVAFKLEKNGVKRSVDVDGDAPLLGVLRDVLGMAGTKFGCGIALCGTCTVHIGGVDRWHCQLKPTSRHD
jgi:xanthine dehydrogenase iron-sulfur cluster and FAD-binding subunit A